MFDLQLKKALELLNIYDPDLDKFLEGKVHSFPGEALDFAWGCFPKTDNNDSIIDIRVVVPKIKDKATLLVNIHEYVHALEFYRNMGKKLILNVEKSEEEARGFEAEYIRKSER